jgi:hypothetical protein
MKKIILKLAKKHVISALSSSLVQTAVKSAISSKVSTLGADVVETAAEAAVSAVTKYVEDKL